MTATTARTFNSADFGIAVSDDAVQFDEQRATVRMLDALGYPCTARATLRVYGTFIAAVFDPGQRLRGEAVIAGPAFNNGYAHALRSVTLTEV